MNIVGDVVSSRQDCETESNGLYAWYYRSSTSSHVSWCPSPDPSCLRDSINGIRGHLHTDSGMHIYTGLCWNPGCTSHLHRAIRLPHASRKSWGRKKGSLDGMFYSPHLGSVLLELQVALALASFHTCYIPRVSLVLLS